MNTFMNRILLVPLVFLLAATSPVLAIQTPANVITLTGDQSIILHWDKVLDPALSGYRVYRGTSSNGPFTLQNTNGLLSSPGFCDLVVVDGQNYYYQVTAVNSSSQESTPSSALAAMPHTFASTDQFLDYVQQANFDYFWYLANPVNGLVPDRSTPGSACSIAAVGFCLTAIGIGIDHGWISRTQGVARVLTTLSTFLNGPQGSATSGVIGYNGWFYHFLDMNSALRAGAPELSSIDTTLLMAGVLYAKQYFNGTNSDEASIRSMADTLFNNVNWTWMARGSNAVSMGWLPESGFLNGNWIGYDEGMILYCLGLGTATNPLPASAWSYWTGGYVWGSNYGESYVQFGPLFGHQYSHCWIDFRHVSDSYMLAHNTTYFENSRRASLAQHTYAIQNSGSPYYYSTLVWGLTACDGPSGYTARGLPPGGSDDGTIAPTAAGGSIAFVPEYSVPTLQKFYSNGFRQKIWTAYGFCDAFNIGQAWFDNAELGIDQGPIVIMIENYRTQKVWRLFMQNPEVQRGLQRAGFVNLPFLPSSVLASAAQNTVTLDWNAVSNRTYQVEYSPDLMSWFGAPTGEVTASAATASWTDNGPPGTASTPFSTGERFYRIYQFAAP